MATNPCGHPNTAWFRSVWMGENYCTACRAEERRKAEPDPVTEDPARYQEMKAQRDELLEAVAAAKAFAVNVLQGAELSEGEINDHLTDLCAAIARAEGCSDA